MKHLNFLSNLLSLSLGSPCTDVSLDRRLTVGSPSGRYCSGLMRLVAISAVLLTIGVGNVWGTDYSHVYTYSEKGTGTGKTWDVTNAESVTGSPNYWKVPSTTSSASVATIPDIFTGKTITSDVVITLNIATFGNGSNPTSSKFEIYNSSDCSSQVTATQGGTLPTSSTYENTTYTISKANAVAGFTDDLVIKIASGTKQIRLKQITVAFSYTASCTSLTMSEVTATPGNTRIDLSWPTVSNASSYTVTCKVKSTGVSAGTVGSVSGSGPKTCAITGLTNGTAYTWSVMPVGTGSYCSSNTAATGDATPNVYYTVTWKNNGGNYTTTSVANGSKPTFPSNPSSCSDVSTTFYGWSTAEWSGTVDALGGKTVYTAASSMPNVSAAVTYYAVFAKKTTGSETSVMGGTFSDAVGSTGWTSSGTGTYSGNGLKFDGTGDYIRSSDLSSNGYTTVTVKFKAGHNGGSGSVLTFTSIDGSGNVIDTKTFTPTEAYNSQSTINSVTLSGATTIKFVKVEMTSKTNNLGMKYCEIFQTPITYSKYLTNCCTNLGSINGSISMSSSTDGTVTISGWTYNAGSTGTTESNVSSYTVKLYKWNGSAWAIANASSTTGGSSGTAATRTGIATDSKSVTYSGLEYGGTYKFTVQPIGNGSSYCDGEETAVTSINGNSLTDNKFINKYSIYIDDATDANYAHNYITSISSHAGSVDITLLANKDYYQYKLSLGGVVWWGNTGKMTSANCSSWTFTAGASNCKLQTNLGGTYTFALAAGTPAISVTYPPDDQASGKNIYFDNSILEWSDIFYRVGSGSTNVKEDFTLVAGTDNFYYTTTPEKSDISAWHIANNTGWTGSNDIYKTKTGDDYAITKSIAFQQYVVTGHMTIIPTTTSSKGSEDKNNNCDFYTINIPTSGMLTHTATITTPSHGTITISNTDQSLSATSTTANLPHRTILTITATPDDGYSLSSLTVNAAAFTSGNTHILAADATIAATFTANKYDVTLKPTSQTGSVTDQVVQATYDAAMPTTIKTAGTAIVIPERTGYSFTGWFDNSSGGKQYYQYTGSPKTLSSANPWDKTSATNLYAQWSINSYTLTWATVRGKIITAGTGAAVNATGNVSSSQEYNTALTAPELGGANGYTFTGWSPEPASNMPAENTTYTAQWSANQYTVTLDANGGEDGATTSVNTTFGQAMPTIAAANLPTREGYRFDGFYTGKTDGTKYYNADGTGAKNQERYSADQKLYAHWVAQTTFSVNGSIVPALTIDDNAAMPSATVPTTCGDCWAFLGWSEDSEESSAIDYASGDTHTFGEPTTLYAVFGQVVYTAINSTSGLVANDYYVIVSKKNSIKQALSNTAHSHYSYDGAAVDVSSYARENADGYYLYNVPSIIVWKFTGTKDEGQLQNVGNTSKYVNLSSQSASILNSTNNLTFTVDGYEWTIKSTYYLGGYSTNSYGYGFDAASSSDFTNSRYHPYLYHQTSSTVTTSPSCDTYTVAWKVGNDNASGSPTTSTNTCAGIEDLPNDPDDDALDDCATKFMGWSESVLTGTGNSAPADLFTTVGGAPKIDGDKTFHAVFATTIGTSVDPIEDTSFSSKDENGSYCNGTFSFKSTGKYLQQQSIWTSSSIANVTVKIRVYHMSNSVADVLRVSLINSDGSEVVGKDLTTTKTGTDITSKGGWSDVVELTPTSAVTGYKVSLKTKNSSGVAINKIERELVASGAKDYVTICCEEPTFTISGTGKTVTDGKISFPVLREDLEGASSSTWAELPITISSNSSGAISIINGSMTEGGGNVDNAGKTAWKLSTWGARAESGGTITGTDHATFTNPSSGNYLFKVKTTTGSTGQGTYRIGIKQAADGDYCEAVVWLWVDVTLRDKFVDAVNGNADINKDGHGAQLATPAESDMDADKNDDCHSTTRRLRGWIKETDLQTMYGTPGETDYLENAASYNSSKIVAPNTNITTSGVTWYAVWGEEE